jgi:hypothetical protein
MGPRQEGYAAYESGKRLEDNPYREEGSIYSDHAQWEEGWYDAESEDDDGDDNGEKRD